MNFDNSRKNVTCKADRARYFETHNYLCENREQQEPKSQNYVNPNFKASRAIRNPRRITKVIGVAPFVFAPIILSRPHMEQGQVNNANAKAPLINKEEFEEMFTKMLEPYKEKYTNAEDSKFADKLWAVYQDKGPLSAVKVFKIFEQGMAIKGDDGLNLCSPSMVADSAGILAKEYPEFEEFEKMLEPYKDKYRYFDNDSEFVRDLVGEYKYKGPIYAMRTFETFKDIMNLKDDNGLNRCYKPYVAIEIASRVALSSDAYKSIIGMKDSFGNPRFEIRCDTMYDIIEAVEKFNAHPDLFLKYAKLNDINGHPRLGLEAINCLISFNDEFDTEDIDKALNLTNDEGSFVFPFGFDNSKVIKRVKENPEALKTQSSSYGPSVDDSLQFWHSEGRISDELWAKYQKKPEAVTLLFGIPFLAYNCKRFNPRKIKDIDGSVLDYIEKYPRSFMALANMRYSYESAPGRFNFDAISKFINSFGTDKKDGTIREISPEIMDYIGLLSEIDSIFNNFHEWLRADDIIKSYEAYKKYPDETFEILSTYKRGKKPNESFICPTIEDVELYTKDKSAFEAKYKMVQYILTNNVNELNKAIKGGIKFDINTILTPFINRTLLGLAVSNSGLKSVVGELLKINDIDINCKDKLNQTAIDIAIFNCDKEMIEILLKHPGHDMDLLKKSMANIDLLYAADPTPERKNAYDEIKQMINNYTPGIDRVFG